MCLSSRWGRGTRAVGGWTAAGVSYSRAKPAAAFTVIRLRPEDAPPGGNAASPTSSAAASASTSPFAQPIPLPGSPTLAAATSTASEATALDSPSCPHVQKDVKQQLERFFEQEWVKRPGTTAEVLFIKRATRATE